MSAYALLMFMAALAFRCWLLSTQLLAATLMNHLARPSSFLALPLSRLCLDNAGWVLSGKGCRGTKTSVFCRLPCCLLHRQHYLCRPAFWPWQCHFLCASRAAVECCRYRSFWLFNAPEARLSLLRVCGLLVMAAGIWLTQVAAAK